MPAAVTAHAVSAAGTSRRSSPGWRASGQSQTRTSGRSFSSRAGPMPSTSPSWSTLVNLPLAARHATMAAAVTGPTPGSASSCSTVAALRSTGPTGFRRGCRAAPARRRGPPPTELPRAARLPRRCRDTDDDLLTVGEVAGKVEPEGVGTGERAAGSRDRIGDPGVGRQGDQPGLLNQPDDTDDHRLPRRR